MQLGPRGTTRDAGCRVPTSQTHPMPPAINVLVSARCRGVTGCLRAAAITAGADVCSDAPPSPAGCPHVISWSFLGTLQPHARAPCDLSDAHCLTLPFTIRVDAPAPAGASAGVLPSQLPPGTAGVSAGMLLELHPPLHSRPCPARP